MFNDTNTLTGQTVIVTGGAGFIGSNVANHLAEKNEVIAVDDCSLGVPGNLNDDVRFVEANVVDWKPDIDADVLIHLAALSSRNMHEEDPQLGARVNVEGFVNSVEQFDSLLSVVFASTSSIYGSETRPCPETMVVHSNTAYEASKLAREAYGEYYSNHYGMNVAGLRFFSVYQGFGGNEKHKGQYANTVAQFADAIADGDRPVVYGDGTQTRDFTHVSDVVDAIEATAASRLDGVFNVGTGDAYSFNEMIAMINDELGSDIEPKYIENPLDDYVQDTKADASRLRSAADWKPTVGFEEGVARVCEPYKRKMVRVEKKGD